MGKAPREGSPRRARVGARRGHGRSDAIVVRETASARLYGRARKRGGFCRNPVGSHGFRGRAGRRGIGKKRIIMQVRDANGTVGLIVKGLLAGVVGVAAMTLGEKIEQALTGRPNSFVPARTLEYLLGRPEIDGVGMNWAMHWGQGIVLGALRAAMAARGVRGPAGSFLFLNLRLLNDQTLENATGVGAPPWTWPLNEQLVDLLHKSIYAAVTGFVADLLVDSGRRVERVRGSAGQQSRRRRAVPRCLVPAFDGAD